MSADIIECPPEVAEPDWQLAQILHSQGIPLKEICARCNVRFDSLQKRITREEWVNRREKARAVLSVTVQTKPSPTEGMSKPQADSLQNASVLARGVASEQLSSIATDLQTLKRQKGANGILGRLDLLKSFVDVSKTVFGWSDTTTTTAVDIRLLQSAESRPMVPAIDVPASVAPTPIEPTLPAVDVPGTVQGRE